jgi:uncharacterized membrane protein
VVIVNGGAIVYERYSPNPLDGPDSIMPAFSIAKSVTSAAIGTLVRDGLLQVDQPAPVSEWHEDPADPRGEITLEHMLHMSTGMDWQDGLYPGTTMSEMVRTDDMAAYAAAQEPTLDPGEQFEYNTGTTTLLASMVGDTIDADPAGVRAYLETELFDLLGMDPVRTELYARGRPGPGHHRRPCPRPGDRPVGDGWWTAHARPHRGHLGCLLVTNRLRTGRLEAFSDGVFAIAITLLVLEISVPEGSGDDLLRAFLAEWPSFLAYLVSFATIGVAWLKHAAITHFLQGVDAIFIRLNLLLLLLVSFLPFPTGLVAEYIENLEAERTATTIFGLNLALISLVVFAMWRYAVGHHLLRSDVLDEEVEPFTKVLTPSLLGYGGLIVVSLFFPLVAIVGFLIVALVLLVPIRPTADQPGSVSDG